MHAAIALRILRTVRIVVLEHPHLAVDQLQRPEWQAPTRGGVPAPTPGTGPFPTPAFPTNVPPTGTAPTPGSGSAPTPSTEPVPSLETGPAPTPSTRPSPTLGTGPAATLGTGPAATPVTGPTPGSGPAPTPGSGPVPTPGIGPSPTLGSGGCTKTVVDFNTFPNGSPIPGGTYVKDEWYAAYGMKLSASGGYGDAPRLFNTSDVGAVEFGDPDLGAPNERCTPSGPGVGEGGEHGMPGENCSPRGNVLIIQEENSNLSIPDDNVDGGMIVFDFEGGVDYVYEIGLLDTDYAGSLEITSSKLGGTPTVTTIPIDILGDNSYQVVSIETVNVLRIKLNLTRSGAVTFISFCYPNTPTIPIATPTSAPIVVLPPALPPAAPPLNCINTTIDFDTPPDGSIIPGGTYVSNEWREAYGISFKATGGLGDIPRIFNSSDIGNRDYGDPDLGSPNQRCNPPGPGRGEGGEPGMRGANCVAQNNILIIQEPNDNPEQPDDIRGGGQIIIDFEREAYVYEMGVMDIEDDVNKSYLECTHSQTSLTQIPIEGYGNNAYQVVPIDIASVNQLVLNFKTSGAITQLTFCLAP